MNGLQDISSKSADIFDDPPNRFIIIYPNASDDTLISASVASLFLICPFLLFKIRTVQSIVPISVIYILSVRFKTLLTAIMLKATCDIESPMNENFLSTSVIPRSDEQSAISTLTTIAYFTNG